MNSEGQEGSTLAIFIQSNTEDRKMMGKLTSWQFFLINFSTLLF